MCAETNVHVSSQEFSVVSYTLLLSLIEYKTLVLRRDYAAANEILPQIPQACPASFHIQWPTSSPSLA